MHHAFSYWERTTFTGTADVIIIGSGLVGLSAALYLKKNDPALNVLVLERGFLPSGASTKNAGFACFGSMSEQLSYLQQMPEEQAVHLAAYKWKGLQRLRQNLGDENIDFFQFGGHELFMQNKDAGESIGKIDYLNKLMEQAIGEREVFRLADEKIKLFGFAGVKHIIYTPFEGQLHTGKMMRTLLQKVYDLGVLVLNSCDVLKMEHSDNAIELSTSQGSFKAGKVILATNAFAAQLFPQLNVVPGRGQVLVTKPVKGLKLKGTYHFNEGYYYFRNIDDRVLFGGGRNLDFNTEATWDFGQTEKVKKSLLHYLREMILPGQPVEVDYWWSGIMGFGDNISPIIKQVEPNIFCAVRCNGMGVAMGSLVGEEVAQLTMTSHD